MGLLSMRVFWKVAFEEILSPERTDCGGPRLPPVFSLLLALIRDIRVLYEQP